MKFMLVRQAMTEQPKTDEKDYYRILRVASTAELADITNTYQRLADLYQHLTTKLPQVSVYAERLNEINEAYEVLSDPGKREAYDRIFKEKLSSPETEAKEPTREEIFASIAQIAREVPNQSVSKKKSRKTWRVPTWNKARQWVTVALAALLLLVFAGGSAFAMAQPEHKLAIPFRGVASTVLMTSAEAIHLIEDIRHIVAAYERNIVSTALQSMRVIEELDELSPVTSSTNDMAYFPSPQHPLFPDYLDKRFSQFKYTVDSTGIISVDTSGATTDTFLEKMERLIHQLAERE
jgi:hypothetical protein